MEIKMLVHEDYDSRETYIKPEITLPEHIDSIMVVHDGGRLTIEVNGVELFYSCLGTRDCSIEITRNKS
jgi:hypothetical protein